MSKWVIYSIQNKPDDQVLYVGCTTSFKRRRKEHYSRFGRRLIMSVIEEAEQEQTALEVERKWINHYWSIGQCSANIAEGKRHTAGTREKISRQQKGKPKPAGTGDKISAATKGVPHNWTTEGWNIAKANQFKTGHYKFSELPKETQDYFRAARAAQWDGISKEERSRMATRRNLNAWANRTPEQRQELGKRISEGKARAKAKAAST